MEGPSRGEVEGYKIYIGRGGREEECFLAGGSEGDDVVGLLEG